MRIACVRTYLLSCHLAEPFAFSQWRYDRRQALLVQVVTEEGAEGWGECYGPAAVAQAAVATWYAPRLVGRDPRQTERIWSELWRTSLDFARHGPMMAAMSGIDMALWDLKGRVMGLPVSELLGGRQAERVPAYATGMYFRNCAEGELIDRLLVEAAGYRDAGFGALKFKVGKNLAWDAALIRAAREAFPDATLMADANHAYDLPEAVRIGRLLEEGGYAWFEEPLSPEHPHLYRQLHDAVRVPLATGECEQTRWGFQALLAPGGVDVAQPDLAYCGGPSEALKIAALASSLGVNVVPHAWGTMLNLATAAHFLAALPRQPGRAEPAPGMLECDRSPNPLRDELFSVPLEIEEGHAIVPERPGLGVEVDRGALRGFLVGEPTETSAG